MDLTALIAIGRKLKEDGYRFATPTPLTHSRIVGRGRNAEDLRDVFGWNLPFAQKTVPAAYWQLLNEGGFLTGTENAWRSLVRFSSLDGLLLAHSGYPTDSPDAVFFGPDTYRFIRAIRLIAEIDPFFSPAVIADIGSGTGAGGFYCSRLFPGCANIFLLDINAQALAFSTANAAINDCSARSLHSDLLSALPQEPDLIISNPPYLVDPKHRAYRDGGGSWGCELAVRIVQQSLARLRPGGKLLLYTGTPVVSGRDIFRDAIQPLLEGRRSYVRYEEIDPDVFGEELEHAPYDRAERIATVMLFVDLGLQPG